MKSLTKFILAYILNWKTRQQCWLIKQCFVSVERSSGFIYLPAKQRGRGLRTSSWIWVKKNTSDVVNHNEYTGFRFQRESGHWGWSTSPYSICQSIRLESNSSQIRQSYKDFTSRLALNYFIISNPWINLVTLLWTWRTLHASVWPDAIEGLHVYNKWSYFINTGSSLVFKTKLLLWYF